jgi:PKD repeat protein
MNSFVRSTGFLTACVLVGLLLTLPKLSFAAEEEEILNAIIRASGAKWDAKTNELHKSLPKGARQRRLGLIPQENKSANPLTSTSTAHKASAPIASSPLPATFDWRNNSGVNYVTPVKDQEFCGSCWAFSSVAAMESRVLIDNPGEAGLNVNLSEQVVVSALTSGSIDSKGNISCIDCCNGGFIGDAANYIQNTGIPIEGCFPYTGYDPLDDQLSGGKYKSSLIDACATYNTDTYRTQASGGTKSAWIWVSNTTVNQQNNGTVYATPTQIKNAIYNFGPVVVTMYVYDDFYLYYQSGIYSYVSGGWDGGHAITAVGWDDTTDPPCFIVKNSWGSTWGESGYFRIAQTELSGKSQFAQNAIAYTSSTGSSLGVPTADFYIEIPAVTDNNMTVTGTAPFSVIFQDTSTTPNASDPIISWFWNFGDGTTSTAQNPTHVYSVAGAYTVSLEVSNQAGVDTGTYINMVTVQGIPVADFSASTTSGMAPLTVQFTDQSSGATGWSWSFSGLGTSTLENPGYTFVNPGTYSVVLTASNSVGSASKTMLISVTPNNGPPTVGITATPNTGTAPLTVQFTAVNSGGGAASYAWAFGDNQTGTGQVVSHTYRSPGTYTAALTGTGPGGAGTATAVIIVQTPSAPNVNITANVLSGTAPLDVNFAAANTGGPVSSWAWSFGDGSTSNIQNPAHTFGSGRYTVTLAAAGAGGTSTKSLTINVAPGGPVSNFTANITSGTAPLNVEFVNKSTGSITSYIWSFGDGTTSNAFNPPVHTYLTAGTYTAALTVIGQGGSDCMTVKINVNPAPPPPVANFTTNVTSGTAPLNVAFTNKSTGSITSYFWSFGDGSTSSATSPPVHTYTKAGTYTATLTVRSPSGSNSVSATINVKGSVSVPVSNFKANVTSGNSPLNVIFINKSTGPITSYLWSFGDGTTSTAFNPPVHTFSQTGTYTATLTVTGPGGSNSVSMTITVNPAPAAPVSNFTTNVVSGTAPLTVRFTNKATGSVTSYFWSFGDGTTSSATNPPVHTYSKAGTYTVALKVTGPGGSNSVSTTINVNPTPAAPVSNFTTNVVSGTVPLIVQFTNGATGSITSYLWSFGDGTTSSVADPPAHTYSKTGTYTATLAVSGPGGTNNSSVSISALASSKTSTRK